MSGRETAHSGEQEQNRMSQTARKRIDRRDEFATDLERLWSGPGVIRYDEQDHERMAWIVFDLVEAAKAEALRDAADWIESTDSQKGIASRALSPGKAFAVAALRDRADRLTSPPSTEGGAR